MTKEFNSFEEIKKYYDEKSNTYIFKENDEMIDLVKFKFDLDVEANIDAWDIDAKNIYVLDINARHINAWNINSMDIKARNINAWNIDAKNIDSWNIDAWNICAINIEAIDINYYAVCYAYENIKCKSIKGKRNNTKHFVLDGKLDIENDQSIQ